MIQNSKKYRISDRSEYRFRLLDIKLLFVYIKIIIKHLVFRQQTKPNIKSISTINPQTSLHYNNFESIDFLHLIRKEEVVSYRPSHYFGSQEPVYEGEIDNPYRIPESFALLSPSIYLISARNGMVVRNEGATYWPLYKSFIAETLKSWFTWDRFRAMSIVADIRQRTITHLDGIAINLCKPGSDNYYHFLFECLPKAIFARNELGSNVFEFALINSEEHSFERKILDAYGFAQTKIVPVSGLQIVSATQLISVTDVIHQYQPTRSVVEALRSVIKTDQLVYHPENTRPKIVFASRGKVASRNLGWEEEFCSAFQAELVEFSEKSFAEVISICQQADIFIGSHGAALANIVYCRPGAIVIEIGGEIDYLLYSRISSLCDLKHYFVWNQDKAALFREITRIIDV